MLLTATNLELLDGVKVKLTFIDGKIIRYDMAKMFEKYPCLIALKENHDLFLNGHLDKRGYGIIWNDELDVDVMTIYEDGELVGIKELSINQKIGLLLMKAREDQGVTQVELSKRTHIDQADISKFEKGLSNPTLSTITKLFSALNKQIEIIIK